MKNLLVAFFIAAICIASIEGISEEMKELAQQLHNTCRDESKTTDDLISAAQKGDFKEDQTLKCYMKCLLDQMAVIDDDGVIDVEAMIALIPEEMKDPQAEAAIRKCGKGPAGKDNCDTVFLMNKCVYAEVPEKYMLM